MTQTKNTRGGKRHGAGSQPKFGTLAEPVHFTIGGQDSQTWLPAGLKPEITQIGGGKLSHGIAVLVLEALRARDLTPRRDGSKMTE